MALHFSVRPPNIDFDAFSCTSANHEKEEALKKQTNKQIESGAIKVLVLVERPLEAHLFSS